MTADNPKLIIPNRKLEDLTDEELVEKRKDLWLKYVDLKTELKAVKTALLKVKHVENEMLANKELGLNDEE